MARKDFSLAAADRPRTAALPHPSSSPQTPAIVPPTETAAAKRGQAYREGKRGVQFFLTDEAFSQMHVILARQGRRKVQDLMEELVDDWFRRENAPRMIK